MNYELFMRAAISEAVAARRDGDRPEGAVAVLGEALVARGRDRTRSSGDPTAHAVMAALREAARRLDTPSLAGITVFATLEPCAMCVGALLESDADALVYAEADRRSGAAGSAIQLCDGARLPRRLSVVSGILESEAAELGAREAPATRRPR